MRAPTRVIGIWLALVLSAGCASGQGASADPTAAPPATVAQADTATPAPQATTAQAITATTAPQATANPAPAATTAPSTAEPTAALGPDQFLNPVISQDFPDPDVLKVGDTYYAYATGNFEARVSVQAARSSDLIDWELLPDAMPAFAPWAEEDPGLVWAPEVTTSADGQTYVLYFTARVAGTTTQCIGVATSAAPEGPFSAAGDEPLICQREQGGSIDASSFVDEDGARYLLWKNDGNCCGGATWIYIQPLSDDGLTLLGEPQQLLRNDKRWEGALIEAPTLWKQDGRYYLFYSANAYNSPDYGVGYAVADAVLGPYTKADGPLVESELQNAVVGPGGQDIVTDPDGDSWMLYHSWGPGYRTMSANELTWEGGAPVLQGPSGKRPELVPAAR